MSAAVRSSATPSSRSGGTLTIPKPTGVVDGDILLAVIFEWNSTATIGAPSGWSLYDTLTGTYGGLSGRGSWYTKTAASEGSSYAFTVGGAVTDAAGMIIAIQDAATPEAISKIEEQRGGSPFTQMNWPTVTSGGANRLILLTGANANTGTVATQPTGYTSQGSDVSASGAIAMGWKAGVGSGATGTLTGASTSPGGWKWQLATISIPSAAAAAATFVPRVTIIG